MGPAIRRETPQSSERQFSRSSEAVPFGLLFHGVSDLSAGLL